MIGSLILPLLILWGTVTVAFAIVMVWKSLAGFKESNVVILDPLEAKQAQEEQQVIGRMQSLVKWAKILGFTSLALLLIVGGLSIYSSMAS